MAIYSTKDYSAAKVNKLQASFQRRLGLAAPATKNQIEGAIQQWLKEVAQEQTDIEYAAAKPVHDPDF